MRIESCLLGYYSEIFLKRNFTPIKFTTPEFSDHYYKNLIGGHIPSRYRSKYNFFFLKKIVSGERYVYQTVSVHLYGLCFVQFCKDIYKQIRGLESLTTVKFTQNHVTAEPRETAAVKMILLRQENRQEKNQTHSQYHNGMVVL